MFGLFNVISQSQQPPIDIGAKVKNKKNETPKTHQTNKES